MQTVREIFADLKDLKPSGALSLLALSLTLLTAPFPQSAYAEYRNASAERNNSLNSEPQPLAPGPSELYGAAGFRGGESLFDNNVAFGALQRGVGAPAVAPPINAIWSGNPRWMSGINFGGETFFGSIAKGINFFGSSVADGDYVPVEIRFSSNTAEQTLCQTFRRPGWNSAGVGVFPGSAWDISDTANPRRLNICFSEWDDGGGANPPPDSIWNPSGPDAGLLGGREYLFIMNSDYDGTGLTYAGINILNDNPDVLYAWWPEVEAGRTLLESEPASLFIKPHYLPLTISNLYGLLPSATEIQLQWVNATVGADYVKVFNGSTYPPTALLDSLDPLAENTTHPGLTPGQQQFYRVAAFQVAPLGCCDVPGDANGDGSVNIADVTFLIAFTFSGGSAPPCADEGDPDGSGATNIADVTYLIALIFSGGPPPVCLTTGTQEVAIAESFDISLVAQKVDSNVTLVGAWNKRSTYGDCWGYEANGTEYALLCARNEGVSIIDIDQTPPVEVGFIASILPGKDAKDVKILGNHAIVIKENEPIQVVDISDVTNPVEVAQIQPLGGSGAHNCMVDGNFLYVVGNHNIGGLEIFDLTNPAAPVTAGTHQPFYYHDVDIRNDTLYAAGINGDGVDILDISNKNGPFRISLFNYAGSGAHNCELLGASNYVAIGDEIGSSGNHIRIFDVADPTNVSLATEIIVDSLAITHNCYELNGLLYIAYYTEGLRIWDVNDPLNPFEVAHYDTYPVEGYGFDGAWNAYPYYTSGRIIVSDLSTGLYVLQYTP